MRADPADTTIITVLKLFGRRITQLPPGISGFLRPTEEGIEFHPAVCGRFYPHGAAFMVTWEALADPAAAEYCVNHGFDDFKQSMMEMEPGWRPRRA